jgi:hypothetical protein
MQLTHVGISSRNFCPQQGKDSGGLFFLETGKISKRQKNACKYVP